MKNAFLCLGLVLTPFASADVSPIEAAFASRYHTAYDPSDCGKNILGLVLSLKPQREDLGGLYVVDIRNKGLSVFGYVNAEMARGESNNLPMEKESNWGHHVVLLDDQGNVYDFDYRTRPSVTPFAEYVERMFLDEKECETPRPREFCGGRDAKLDYYELESVDAWSALASDDGAFRRKVKLRDAVKDWRVLIP